MADYKNWYFLRLAWYILHDAMIDKPVHYTILVGRAIKEVKPAENQHIKKPEMNGGHALSYLEAAGLIEKPARGVRCITESGKVARNMSFDDFAKMLAAAHEDKMRVSKKSAGIAKTTMDHYVPDRQSPPDIDFENLPSAVLFGMLDSFKSRLVLIQNELQKRIKPIV